VLTRIVASSAILAAFAIPAHADVDGANAVEQDTGSGYRIDVTVTYTGGGAGSYSGNYGIGTVRVTLPGFDKAHPPTFATPAAEPDGYTCGVVAGADGVEGGGFQCSARGTANGNQTLLFPTAVTLHLTLPACYQFPPADSKGAARADLWSAGFDPGLAPDATYALASDLTCPPAAPETPATPVAPTTRSLCVVPRLTGLTSGVARTKLGSAGCKLGKITRSYSKKVKKGRVISQRTAAGKKVAAGTAVGLTVSRGPRKK
jgi:hypothetical protein